MGADVARVSDAVGDVCIMTAAPDNLDALTNAELDAQLAALLPPPEHVWVETNDADECERCGMASWQDPAPCRIWWTHNPQEVLRLLDTLGPQWGVTIERIPEWPEHPWQVQLEDDDHCYLGRAKEFGRAAVMALIRAKRAERETAA